MLEQGCVTEAQVGNAHLSEDQKEEKSRELYERFAIKTVHVGRPINSNARLRGKVTEVLVRTGV